MDCANCGRLNPLEASFCIYCGAMLARPAARRRLPLWPLLALLLLALGAGAAYRFIGGGRERMDATPAHPEDGPAIVVVTAVAPAAPAPPATAGSAAVEPSPPPTKTPAPAATALPTVAATALPPADEIVFQSNRDGDYDLYIVALNGGDARPLTINFANDQYPRVSPDGRRIAFQSDRDGNEEIYVMNRDGSGQTRLTTDPANDRLPAWSPDGTQLVFTSQRSGTADLFIINADGSGLRQVTDTPQREGHVAWSVDGRLAYNVTIGNVYQIFTRLVDGGGEQRLTFSTVDEWSAEWSPNGQTLLYLTEREHSTHPAIYLMDADGGNPRRIYESERYEWSPIWSTDGTTILFSVSATGGETEQDDIYLMDASGGNVRLLVSRGSYPSWAVPAR